ncbi:MAG TPA: DUF4397 domain-containing protein [Steroidobacteraceae bacterium]|nr:DUF4397 domain-containing protein [Steroidobacteraceae bacterium]
MFNRNFLMRAALVAAALALVSCGGGGGGGGKAKIRLLNLSTGYTSLDLITNVQDDDDDDVTQSSNVALDSVSEYVDLDADNYTIKLKRTGSGSVLRSFTGEQLVNDTINTYVAFGEVGAFGALKLDDTQDDADAGETKLALANLSSAGNLDVYITGADVDLDDTTPVASGVGAGFQNITVDSGSFRLRVTASGDTSDVRLDIPTFTLADKGVAALIFTSTQGGTLANAIYLPQEGQPTKLTNAKSRVRAAIGAANGANASVQVGGVTVLATATAGVIGSRYTLLDSGSQAVTLVVNGTQVTVPNVQLSAGADYTLLVYSTANGPTTSLVVDDNRLPTSSTQVKLRLLNGMSTLAAPITLSLDFSPLVEGTLLGEVSDEVEVSSGSDRQLDVSNTSTAAAILTRTGLSLQQNSVYTFFMTDNGATPIGVLRRDR